MGRDLKRVFWGKKIAKYEMGIARDYRDVHIIYLPMNN